MKYNASISAALRFSRDKTIKASFSLENDESQIINYYLRNGLLVNNLSTPTLDAALSTVCNRLNHPRENVTSFVYPSPDIQATCRSLNGEKCIIQISSSLANLLDEEELTFIYGHELAHHLLEHYKSARQKENLENLMQRRSQEISVDRIGLYCCNNLKPAMSAIVKTISGLDKHHLGLNIGQFINQLSKAGISGFYENSKNTHPSFLFRAKALLLFFDQELFEQIKQGDAADNKIMLLNEKIEKEMDKLVEAPILDLVKTLEAELEMWASIKGILASGAFTKKTQEAFCKKFGSSITEKIYNLLRDNSKPEVIRTINSNLQKASHELQEAFPSSFELRKKKILKKIKINFDVL